MREECTSIIRWFISVNSLISMQTASIMSLETLDERKMQLTHIFNMTAGVRALLSEGIQLLIFMKVADLYTRYVSNEDIPIFAWLLFARQSSENPRSYYANHIQSAESTIPHQVYSVVFIRPTWMLSE
mgnify:CR=1 FL=1